MAGSLSLNIPGTTVLNDGSYHTIATQSFAPITPVNVIAGQDLSASNFTLRTDANPASFPKPGTLAVRATDVNGNGYEVTITYTNTSGQGFTGCNVVSGNSSLTSVASSGKPIMTALVSIDRIGAVGQPWLNTLTAVTKVSFVVQSSEDNGSTWKDEANISSVGGIITVKGNTVTQDTLKVGPIDPLANVVRMLASVSSDSPSPVFLTGTATVTTL